MALLDLFGFKVKDKTEGRQIPSVISPSSTDGSIIVDNAVVSGGWQGYAYDLDSAVKTENDQIKRYREVAQMPEIESAIDDIVNEAIVSDQEDYPVKLELDNLKVSDGIKKKLQDSFAEVLNILDFNDRGHDIFRQWYVDGKLYFHILFKDNDIKKGIAEVRQIDPMKIRKVKNITKVKNDKGIDIVDRIEEYFVYNDRGIVENSVQGIKLSPDSVVMVTSGMMDVANVMTVGYLQKAIKPANQLRMLEDAIVIYTITRAPERRIFYIDVGSLPKMKAEQYVTDIMNKFKNKLVYNAATGELADSKKHTAMIEDFWLPRRDGSKGTEISSLPGSQSLIQSDFIEYFQNKLYQSLNVPINRMKPDAGFTLGKSQEITREELKFNKFVNRLRIKFSGLFHSLLRIQLIAKGIIRADEWDVVKSKIRYDFIKDNHFSELKDAEILTNRMATLQMVDPYLGKYYSKRHIQKHVLMMDDEEIDQIEKEISAEGDDAVPSEITTQQKMMIFQQNMEQQAAEEQPDQEQKGE
jgi:hypothetical protein